VTAVLPLLLVAAAASQPPAVAELVRLYDSACQRGETPGPDFVPVSAAEIPDDIAHFYVGPQQGHYWRRAQPIPAFVAQTRGPGHWGGEQAACTVAVRGAGFNTVAAFYVQQLDAPYAMRDGRLQTSRLWGMTRIAINSRDGHRSVLVYERPDHWVSLTTGGPVRATGQD
jgi:hypothetical protein